MPASPDAVILDLDGTIVDSAPEFLATVNRLFDELDRPAVSLDQVRNFMGYGIAVLLDHAFEASGGLPDADEFDIHVTRAIELFYAHHLELTRPFPGVVETLDRLRSSGVRFGLCTNKPHQAAVETLEGLGLDRFFTSVVGRGEASAQKPDAAHIYAVIERLGAEPGGVVMVGDTETDIEAAKNAGVASIAVSYGYSRVPVAELGANLVIDEFTQLPGALARLGKPSD
jgi:phosphoglycolate phosphatase